MFPPLIFSYFIVSRLQLNECKSMWRNNLTSFLYSGSINGFHCSLFYDIIASSTGILLTNDNHDRSSAVTLIESPHADNVKAGSDFSTPWQPDNSLLPEWKWKTQNSQWRPRKLSWIIPKLAPVCYYWLHCNEITLNKSVKVLKNPIYVYKSSSGYFFRDGSEL